MIASAVLAQPPIRCSQLSSTISTSCNARASSSASGAGRPGWAASRSASQMTAGTVSWSVTAASSTSHTPSPDPSSSSAATCSPSRSSRPRRPGQGDQPRRFHQGPDLCHLPLAADERRQLGGQVVRQRRVAQRPQRREPRLQARRLQLEDPLRAAQVLQPVAAQIGQRRARRQPVPHQRSRRLRRQHLPPVRGRGHPAARCPSRPTSPVAVRAASPQWIPIRTRTRSPPGHACPAMACCICSTAATHPRGEENTAKTHPPACPPRGRRARPAPTGPAHDDRPAPARNRRPPGAQQRRRALNVMNKNVRISTLTA